MDLNSAPICLVGIKMRMNLCQKFPTNRGRILKVMSRWNEAWTLLTVRAPPHVGSGHRY